ncbi:MAG TPA: outer membrane lipoprotein-sorting protein [Deltaproteobacteria bacterium]|nr:outer membrane lipoprotein-sorting protein [Deltaproteobacteria bacterium]HPR56092.1 outer membrane lipoprotein-sorting protein [Deltaproteobacteria bacterium]HXK48776.1 outer membrane lipoprotein-sorting protein [Deltaproteobacteria bacterium]
MRRVLTGCAVVALLLFVTASPAPAMDGNQILKKVDEVQSASKDSVASVTMTLVDKGGQTKDRTMKVWRRHYKDKDDWSVLKFAAPADIRNLGFLSLADDKMYLYLPAFDRVRRIASHARKESFAGSDLSNDDLSTGKYSNHYDAQISKETDSEYVLELKRKPGSERIYPRVTAWVNKKDFTVSKMDLYDDAGKLWKSSEIKNEQVQGYWTPMEIKMTDVTKNHSTIMKITKIEYDKNLEDDIFTERYLKRSVKGD